MIVFLLCNVEAFLFHFSTIPFGDNQQMTLFIVTSMTGEVHSVSEDPQSAVRTAILLLLDRCVSTIVTQWGSGKAVSKTFVSHLEDCRSAMRSHDVDDDVLISRINAALDRPCTATFQSLHDAMRQEDVDTTYRKVWWKQYKKGK